MDGCSPESIVRTYYARVDSPFPQQVVDLFAPEAIYRRPGYAPLRGTQDLLEFFGEKRVIVSGVHTLERVVVVGSAVAVEGTFVGVLKSGVEVSLRFADFFDLDGELIRARNTYFDAPLV